VAAVRRDIHIIRPNELIDLEANTPSRPATGVVYVENKGGIRFGTVELLQKLKRGGRSTQVDLFPPPCRIRDRTRTTAG